MVFARARAKAGMGMHGLRDGRHGMPGLRSGAVHFDLLVTIKLEGGCRTKGKRV
jgi:hypothetical protein